MSSPLTASLFPLLVAAGLALPGGSVALEPVAAPAAPAVPAPVPEPASEKTNPPAKGRATADAKPEVPDDLLEDDHLREEYGVNQFTTPSIRKIFGQLEALGSLPYEKLKRPLPKSTASDRSMVALSLGVLIGDGFLSVQTEKVSDLEDVGRAVLKHAKVLGAGARVTEHAKSLLENSALGDWKTLRDDLAGTQKDVEGDMVLLRDMEMAHLISLGGWLRGLQIASGTASDSFTPDRAGLLARTDLIEYLTAMLAALTWGCSGRLTGGAVWRRAAQPAPKPSRGPQSSVEQFGAAPSSIQGRGTWTEQTWSRVGAPWLGVAQGG